LKIEKKPLIGTRGGLWANPRRFRLACDAAPPTFDKEWTSRKDLPAERESNAFHVGEEYGVGIMGLEKEGLRKGNTVSQKKRQSGKEIQDGGATAKRGG